MHSFSRVSSSKVRGNNGCQESYKRDELVTFVVFTHSIRHNSVFDLVVEQRRRRGAAAIKPMAGGPAPVPAHNDQRRSAAAGGSPPYNLTLDPIVSVGKCGYATEAPWCQRRH